MGYGVTIVIPSRWIQPGSYALTDLNRSGVVIATPFRRFDPPRRFGVRAPALPRRPAGRWGRYLPYVGLALLAGETLDQVMQRPAPKPFWEGYGAWELYHDCGKGVYDTYDTLAATFKPDFNCLDNQALGLAVDLPAHAFPTTNDLSGANTLIVGHGHILFGDVFSALDNNLWFNRLAPGPNPDLVRPAAFMPPAPPLVDVPPGVYAEPDPNLEREYKRGYGRGVGEPQEAPLPGPEEWPPFRIEIEPKAGPQTETIIDMVPGNPFTPRSPPKENVKEKKVITKAQWIGIIAFKILDFVSEAADMVEAVYASLPRATRRRVEREERKRRGLPPGASLERPGDQMGQYGLNGADWRLRAIWENWREIDAPNAVYNLIANEVEDAAYGRAYRARDRLLGRGKYRRNPASLYRERQI